jgi:NADP-dependent 3-hydroxy acid dehydrogenase YdfG
VIEQLTRDGGAEIIFHVAGGAASEPSGGFAQLTPSCGPAPELNLLSAVRPDRGLIPTMIESRPGAIMHVSSIASSTAEPCRRSEPEARVAA